MTDIPVSIFERVAVVEHRQERFERTLADESAKRDSEHAQNTAKLDGIRDDVHSLIPLVPMVADHADRLESLEDTRTEQRGVLSAIRLAATVAAIFAALATTLTFVVAVVHFATTGHP